MEVCEDLPNQVTKLSVKHKTLTAPQIVDIDLIDLIKVSKTDNDRDCFFIILLLCNVPMYGKKRFKVEIYNVGTLQENTEM